VFRPVNKVCLDAGSAGSADNSGQAGSTVIEMYQIPMGF